MFKPLQSKLSCLVQHSLCLPFAITADQKPGHQPAPGCLHQIYVAPTKMYVVRLSHMYAGAARVQGVCDRGGCRFRPSQRARNWALCHQP